VATRQQSERELCAKREFMQQITLLTYLIKKATKEEVMKGEHNFQNV
jgi:hypothetical protein